MMQTHTVTKSRFVRNEFGEITGTRPVFVKQEMEYRDNGTTVRFAYDTRTSSETDVNRELSYFDPFVANLFSISISLSSRRIWGKRDYIPFETL